MEFKIESFPHELFINLENSEDFVGRLTLNFYKAKYSVEIDILYQESRKIFYHVDILYDRLDLEQAIDESVQRLSNYLHSLKKKRNPN